MASPPDKRKYLDSVLIVFVLASTLFVPPFITTWARPGAPWFLPYIVWFGVIVLIALVQRLRGRYEL